MAPNYKRALKTIEKRAENIKFVLTNLEKFTEMKLKIYWAKTNDKVFIIIGFIGYISKLFILTIDYIYNLMLLKTNDK